MKVFTVLSAVALLVLNISFFLLYFLWQAADGAAINRMESGTGMDPAQMLPNANLMWVAANGSLVALLALDILAVLFAVKILAGRRNGLARINAPEENKVSV